MNEHHAGGIQALELTKDYQQKQKRSLFHKELRLVRAVDHISLRIPRGSITGLLGINGAGKTTTIRMLASVIEPTSGTLTMDGVDAVKNHLWVKGRINVISGGERNLYWRLTARENLRYFGSLYGLGGQLLAKRIEALLAAVGLTASADTPVERYSKGMKQRLQIARGLINDPDYIFLDEPTLGLDILIAREIRELVARLAREEGKGVLLTTHYISEAEELCDYIYVLEKGRMAAQGTREELKSLFSRKPTLKVRLAAPLSEEQRPILADRFATALCFSAPNQLELTGTADEWSKLLALLPRCGAAMVEMEIREPRLEDVLMEILR